MSIQKQSAASRQPHLGAEQAAEYINTYGAYRDYHLEPRRLQPLRINSRREPGRRRYKVGLYITVTRRCTSPGTFLKGRPRSRAHVPPTFAPGICLNAARCTEKGEMHTSEFRRSCRQVTHPQWRTGVRAHLRDRASHRGGIQHPFLHNAYLAPFRSMVLSWHPQGCRFP